MCYIYISFKLQNICKTNTILKQENQNLEKKLDQYLSYISLTKAASHMI